MAEPSNNTTQVKVVHRLEVGENAFWLMLWTVMAIAVVTLILFAIQRANERDKAIIASPDPVAAACATGSSGQTSNQCMALLARASD